MNAVATRIVPLPFQGGLHRRPHYGIVRPKIGQAQSKPVHFPRPEQQQGSGCFRQHAQKRRSRAPMLLLTPSPTTWYILQRGIHRISGIYSPAPSASGCVRRRGLAPDTKDLLRNLERVMSLEGWVEYARLARRTRLEEKA